MNDIVINQEAQPLRIPTSFTQRMREMLGEQSDAWLARIPAVVDKCSDQWGCVFGPPISGLSINYVVPGKRLDGVDVVLKICIPGTEYATEADALTEYDGDGAVRLLARDDQSQVLLLEQLVPGTTLTAMPDVAAATHIAARLMQRLWRPSRTRVQYPTVAVWMQHMAERSPDILGENHAVLAVWIQRVLGLYTTLAQDQSTDLLLHGDLHMDNILSAQRAPWLVIDPKGVIGPAVWETGPLILSAVRDHTSQSAQRDAVVRTVYQLAEELNFDVATVAAWGQIRSILSGWWTVEDHGSGWEQSIDIAKWLGAVLPVWS